MDDLIKAVISGALGNMLATILIGTSVTSLLALISDKVRTFLTGRPWAAGAFSGFVTTLICFGLLTWLVPLHGPVGPKGADGKNGEMGAKGEKGEKGDKGDPADVAAIAARIDVSSVLREAVIAFRRSGHDCPPNWTPVEEVVGKFITGPMRKEVADSQRITSDTNDDIAYWYVPHSDNTSNNSFDLLEYYKQFNWTKEPNQKDNSTKAIFLGDKGVSDWWNKSTDTPAKSWSMLPGSEPFNDMQQIMKGKKWQAIPVMSKNRIKEEIGTYVQTRQMAYTHCSPR